MSTISVEKIRERLRIEFNRLGLSFAEVARLVGVDDYKIRDVVSRTKLSVELLSDLVTKCGVDGDYVLTGQRNAHEITTDHVRTAFQMVRDAEAQLPMGQYLDETQRVDAVCSLLKAAQSLGHIPDRSAAIAVLMSMV